MLSIKSFNRRTDALVCGVIGASGLWVGALALPVITTDSEGGTPLLLAATVLQLAATVIGSHIPIDLLFVAASAGCALLVAVPMAGSLVFAAAFGALFRHYLDCVWAPVQCARMEFVGQVVAGAAFVPLLWTLHSWDPVLIILAILCMATAIVVKADKRDRDPVARAPSRILIAYGCVCAGIGCFSLGGILTIAADTGKLCPHQTTAAATGSILAGAGIAALVSGLQRPSPALKYRLGCYIASTVALSSFWAHSMGAYVAMSAAFGISAGLILINARNMCFNNSNAFFIIANRVADLVGPLLLVLGLSPRALMQACPGFVALSLMLLPSDIDEEPMYKITGLRG